MTPSPSTRSTAPSSLRSTVSVIVVCTRSGPRCIQASPRQRPTMKDSRSIPARWAEPSGACATAGEATRSRPTTPASATRLRMTGASVSGGGPRYRPADSTSSAPPGITAPSPGRGPLPRSAAWRPRWRRPAGEGPRCRRGPR